MRRDLCKPSRRESFHVTKPQFLFLAGFSVMFTLVQLSFFVAVALTSVAVALTLQYTAPAFVVLWEKLRHGRRIGSVRWRWSPPSRAAR